MNLVVYRPLCTVNTDLPEAIPTLKTISWRHRTTRQDHWTIHGSGERRRDPRKENMLIILIILLLVFGFGGYRMGPGLGYYGGGGISLILLIVIVLLLLRVI
jgi:hypothetical protein